MKTVLRFCKVFVILIAAYFAFAVLSCWLPDKAVRANIEKTAPLFQREGAYPNAIIGMRQFWMDNYTDGLIMNQIYCIDRKHPVKSAMKLNRANESGREWDQPGLLLRMVNGEDMDNASYPRYWHGNTFLFKWCFLLNDLNLLRWWLFTVSTLLLVAFFCVYYRKAGLLKTLALASGFVAVCGFVTQFSMQFFPVLAITVVTSILLVQKGDTPKTPMLFFIVGSLTCFFDLLTAPLLTLGLPLAVMMSLKDDDTFRVKDNLVEIIKLAVLWGLGFALTFLAKWALASLILGIDVFADAYDSSVYRLGVEDFTRWDAVHRNFNMLNLPMICIGIASVVVLQLTRKRQFNYKKALVYIVIGLSPYIWYFILSNHSYYHFWFTYRIQAIAVVCLFLFLSDLFVRKKT